MTENERFGLVFTKTGSINSGARVILHRKLIESVLDEPYSAKPAQQSGHTAPPPPGLHRMDTVPAYVDWRACTDTPLSAGG
jgi:hypothetical protein